MKTAAVRPAFMARPVVPLPNAVSRRQVLHKVLDGILIAVSGVGIATMLLVLLTLI